jgi:hypothetical protein
MALARRRVREAGWRSTRTLCWLYGVRFASCVLCRSRARTTRSEAECVARRHAAEMDTIWAAAYTGPRRNLMSFIRFGHSVNQENPVSPLTHDLAS